MLLKTVRRFFRENRTYKLASLCIAFLLWLILLSRRDFEVTKSFDIEFRMNDQFVVKTFAPKQIKVHLFGPRAALKRVLDGTWSNSVVIDATSLGQGKHRVRIDRGKIDLPFGAKAISVTPNLVTFEIIESSQ